MFCPKCGTDQTGMKFCTACGTPLADIATPTNIAPPKLEEKKPKKKKTWLWIVILSALILIAAGIFCFFYFSGDSTKEGICTVSFETDGGTEIDDIEVEEGEYISPPDNPEKDGYIFIGWCDSTDFDEPFMFDSTPIEEDITLYAYWFEGDEDVLQTEYVAYQLDIGFQQGDNINHVTRDITLPTSIEGVENVTATWSASSDTITPDGHVTRPTAMNEIVTLTLTVTNGEATTELTYDLMVIKQSQHDPASIPNNSVIDLENMNEGSELEISYNAEKSQVVSIDGKYSDLVVESADDALAAIQGVHTIIGLENAYEELDIRRTNMDEYGAIYSFSQTYNGYEVYSRRVTTSVDKNGYTNHLNSGLYATAKLEYVDTSINIDQATAEENAALYYGENFTADSEKTSLVYYTIGAYETNPVFAYKIHVSGTNASGEHDEGIVFISPIDGSVLCTQATTTAATSKTGSGKDELNNSVTFPVAFYWTDFFFYYMQDLQRDICMYDQYFLFFDTRIGGEFNWWTDKTAISAYTNVITTYDWYQSVLGHTSLDGQGCDVNVIVHNDWYYDNAYWDSGNKTLNFCENNPKSTLKTTTASGLDIVAHEYTHAVFDYVAGDIPYENTTGAIDEGYADIFACLIDGNWEIGESWTIIRSASNPTQYGDPDKLSSSNYIPPVSNPDPDLNDRGGVHTNGSLLYHAAYLMHANGMTDLNLAKLWYKSMELGYTASSDYYTVRHNVLQAATILGLSDIDVQIIKNAFDAVEIFGPRGTLDGYVYDINGNPIPNASIIVRPNETIDLTVTSNANGYFEATLDKDTYSVEIVVDGYIPYTSTIEIKENELTTINAVLVQDGKGVVTGNVVSATSALVLEGVELNVRSGFNSESGNILAYATTNEFGEYIFELDAGYYTIEMIYEGYTTGYVNALVSANNTTITNGSLSPLMTNNTYRVVLTWGAYPTDLDSHLEGLAPDGAYYHIYYNDQNAYDYSGNHIANLDVDDTTSYGPETTTFLVDTDGSYLFYVHRYSSGSLPDSGAVVEVYNGDRIIATYNIDSSVSSSYTYWNVFTIQNGIFQTLNTYE